MERTIRIDARYLNIPVSHATSRGTMTLSSGKSDGYSFEIRLADGKPDYWVFVDMAESRGRKVRVSFPEKRAGMSDIYCSGEIAGADSLYMEAMRPQTHYTPRRGWNNDPNGLIYNDGEYHLFYQHNPFEREWGNMHWGHAVSRDLLHWQELPEALRPDANGAAFSGTAVIDHDNTAGFGAGAMVAVYTADSPSEEVQCLAFSLDKGRTWTKYEGNPVLRSKERWNSRDTRDPKVFWHAPSGCWVMVLNERNGHSIYNSSDLKHWEYRSHVPGFWECPELFPLSTGNLNAGNLDAPDGEKWVMYDAPGNYMIGDFDGSTFTPTDGKLCNRSGSAYASQTFGNIPAEDGRRIEISWGRISFGDAPFNGTFLYPVELSLVKWRDALRLRRFPVEELKTLEHQVYSGVDLSQEQAGEVLSRFNGEEQLHIAVDFIFSYATSAGISLNGDKIVNYDLGWNRINGQLYFPEDPTSLKLRADIYIDKSVVEVFIDGGLFSYSYGMARHNGEDFRVFGNDVHIDRLEISTMEPIWK